MGTNYFIKKGECKECGSFDTEEHIGKNSGGWRFLFHTSTKHPTPENLLEYIEENKNSIYNEYDDKIAYNEFLRIIKPDGTERRHPKEEQRGEYDCTNAEFC